MPGRDQDLAGKGKTVCSLGMFSWNLWAFRTGARKSHELHKGWMGTRAAVVHTTSAHPSRQGFVYAAATQPKIIYKIDPHVLSNFVVGEDYEVNEINIEGFNHPFIQEDWVEDTKAMCILNDTLYMFGDALYIAELSPQSSFEGARQLTKGWANTKAVVCDGSKIYAVGNSRQGKTGALYNVGTDGISDNLLSHEAFYDAKGIACLGDEIYVIGSSIWAVNKLSLEMREVAQGWGSTVAVASDKDWLYLVTSTGLLPHQGSIHRMDDEGRSEVVSESTWGCTRSMVVWPSECAGKPVEGYVFQPGRPEKPKEK